MVASKWWSDNWHLFKAANWVVSSNRGKKTKATFPTFPLDLCYNPDLNDNETTIECSEEPNPVLNISTQEIDDILGIEEPNENTEVEKEKTQKSQETFSFSSSFSTTDATAFVTTKEPKTVGSERKKSCKGK